MRVRLPLRSTALALALAATPSLVAKSEEPFERTETRKPCMKFDPLRTPHFGDTHVHTAFSFDAMGQGTRNGPRDAYRFARGEAVRIQPYEAEGVPARYAQLRRPLDFAVVTDHSDLLGETQMCQVSGSPGYDSLICTVVRRWPKLGYMLVNGHVYSTTSPARYSFCGEDGKLCIDAARAPWREIRDAAETFYDRGDTCAFTTFVGYEWTGMPDGKNIHRNVIFRNEVVQEMPTTYLETPSAEGLWDALIDECLDADDRCDVLAIPHNSNVSAGLMFTATKPDGRPIDSSDARRRARLERLVEVTQHKGDSECRMSAEDELCSYETLPWPRMMDTVSRSTWGELPPRIYAREVLTEGLVLGLRLGVNPFQFGLIGSTDTHLGTPGWVDEDQFAGHAAGTVNARFEIPDFPDEPRFNPGGLAVFWAEENSRDSLFEAMRRREAYGTSGPQMTVRFFGGWNFDPAMCESPSFAAEGYARGVPMGGDLPPRASTAAGAPTFAVSVLRDAGENGAPSTPLQRIEIVKSWAENGQGHERVYEIAGDPTAGLDLDLATCRPANAFDSLCATWRDPDFDSNLPALYYARAVEVPSCRWNTYFCNRQGVDCSDPSTAPGSLAACCDPEIPASIQERAWTSPIWYTPTQPAQ